MRDMKFTTIQSQCVHPLVATDSAINYYPGIPAVSILRQNYYSKSKKVFYFIDMTQFNIFTRN